MIQLSKNQIAEAYKKGPVEYINLYTDAYLAEIDHHITTENIHKLSGHQHALLAYRYFREEVNHGGFVQLIQNGYGGYIFDNPTAKALRLFGARGTSKIIYRAKEIFDANREALERETTQEEFSAMYVEFEEFDEIEEEYFQIEPMQTKIIAKYVNDNRELFAEIV